MAEIGRAVPTQAGVKAGTKKKKMNNKFLIGGVVLALVLGYLIFQGIQSSSVYYMTVSEVKAQGQAAYADTLRIGGKVLDGTIESDTKTMILKFTVTDDKETLPVVYKGVVPDTFQPDADVILEGKLTPGGVFEANTLLAKCPSKYVPGT